MCNQDFGQVRVGAVAREPVEIVEEFFLRIGAEIAVGDFLVGEFGHALQIFDRFVGESHHAAREAAVAAGFFIGSCFEHQNLGAVFMRGKRGAQRGVAFAGHDYVVWDSHVLLRGK